MEEKGSMTRMQLVMDFSSCKMIPIKCVNPAADGGGGHTDEMNEGEESETFLLTQDDLLHLHVISHSPYYYYQFLLLITF